jgi:hypothetical protein
MRKLFILTAALAITAACGRDDAYEAGGEVEDTVNTLRVPDIDVDVGTDTVTLPDLDIDTKKDTIIVDRPVIRRDTTN